MSNEFTASLPDERSVHVLDQRIDHEMLREALSRLSEDHQRVLVLRFVEDLSSAQVAALMGKSDGAVRVLQYRALAALREIVAKRTLGVKASSAS